MNKQTNRNIVIGSILTLALTVLKLDSFFRKGFLLNRTFRLNLSRSICMRLIILSGITIVTSFGCGTPGTEVPISQTTAIIGANHVQEVTVQLESYYYKPSRITVVVDVPVRLKIKNETFLTPHNFSLHAKEAGIDVDTDIGHGKTVDIEFTPTKVGEYKFFCDVGSHEMKGMVGTLVVKARN